MLLKKTLVVASAMVLAVSSLLAVRGLAVDEGLGAMGIEGTLAGSAESHEHTDRAALGPGSPVSEIRGSTTLREVIEGYKLTAVALLREAKLPENLSLDLSLKEATDTVSGLGVDAVRVAVTNLLHPPAPTALSLDDDLEALGDQATGSSHAVRVEPGAPGSDIRGSMTLRQIAEFYGLSTAALIKEAKLPRDVPVNSSLRDLKTLVPGLQIETVRVAVSALVKR